MEGGVLSTSPRLPNLLQNEGEGPCSRAPAVFTKDTSSLGWLLSSQSAGTHYLHTVFRQFLNVHLFTLKISEIRMSLKINSLNVIIVAFFLSHQNTQNNGTSLRLSAPKIHQLSIYTVQAWRLRPGRRSILHKVTQAERQV